MSERKSPVAPNELRIYQGSDYAQSYAQVMVNTSSNGMLLFNMYGQMLYANAAADRLFGEPLRPFYRKSLFTWIHRLGWARLEQVTGLTRAQFRGYVRAVAYAPDQPTHRIFEQHASTGDSRFIDEEGKPVVGPDDHTVGWLLIWRDVTEEHHHLMAREEMSHMLVHDLRSPLTAIIGSLTMMHDLLSEEPVEMPLYDEILQIAQSSGESMLSLIESLLDIARFDRDGMMIEQTNQSLQPVIDYACTSVLSLTLSAHIALDIDVSDDLPPVFIDADKIQRVMVNLLDNALRYAPMGGHIDIHAHAMPDGKAVRVCVADDGPGIPEDEREHIFSKFVQLGRHTQRGHRGTGLGLAFCKLAVEAHGGQIWVQEAPEGGAAFCFTLPVRTEKIAPYA